MLVLLELKHQSRGIDPCFILSYAVGGCGKRTRRRTQLQGGGEFSKSALPAGDASFICCDRRAGGLSGGHASARGRASSLPLSSCHLSLNAGRGLIGFGSPIGGSGIKLSIGEGSGRRTNDPLLLRSSDAALGTSGSSDNPIYRRCR